MLVFLSSILLFCNRIIFKQLIDKGVDVSEPFLAEIRLFGFNFAPRGWALCDGQILPINQNQSLYSLLGTTYGGDGRTSFGLPDLRGRSPMHVGNSDNGLALTLGQQGVQESHALTVNELPSHNHRVNTTGDQASNTSLPNNVLASQARGGEPIYEQSNGSGANDMVAMNTATISSTGGDQAHNNMQPGLVVGFAIALQGVFPSRN